MKKIQVLLLSLLLNTSILVFAQTRINEIEVSGNRNVSKERILMLMKMKPGVEFNEEVLIDDIKKIGETGFFSSIGYDKEEVDGGINIKLLVVENPVIKDIKCTGNSVFTSKKLLEFLDIKKGDILNEVKISRGIEEIKSKYREKGFYLTEVNYRAEDKDRDVILNISIKEEGRGYVSSITFEGNKSFSSYRLRKLMKIKQRNMPFIRGTFKEEIFEKDIGNISSFYRDNGFLDVEVDKTVSQDKKGRMLVLHISLKEGMQYHLGDISFQGNLLVDEKKLRSLLPFKEKGQLLSRKKADENIRDLSLFYMNKGYLKIKVDEIPVMAEKPGVVNIVYFIEPDEIFSAGEIVVRGNTKTRDKVIRREVKIEPGEKITSDKIRKSFSNLFDLNYFDRINIYPEFTDKPGVANVVVDVVEKGRTGLFMIGGGYSSVDDLVGMVSIQQSNFDIANPPSFIGGGQNLSLSAEFGTKAKNYRLSFTEPYFFDRPVWFGTDLYRTSRMWSDYTEDRTGAALRIGRRWDKSSLGFTLRTEEIGLSDIDVPSPLRPEEDMRKSSIMPALVLNTLDSQRSPRKGDMVRLSVECAGDFLGGDISFVKPILNNDLYFPLGKAVFHSMTIVGMVRETGDTEVIPVYERFFGGGIGTVRGYKERELGPSGSPLDGGQSIFAQNFELIYPLYEDILKGVLFFDAGNVWKEWDKYGDLRSSFGAGFKVMVPFLNAPIEIYYGRALDREPGEPEGRFHIGMSFGF